MYKDTFITLGKIFFAAATSAECPGLETHVNALKEISQNYHNYNGWFTEKFVKMQLLSLATMLNENDLTRFEEVYSKGVVSDKTVKIIAAGNIPLVCFHDIFCVLFSGKKCVVKFSQKDRLLPFAVMEILKALNPELKDRFIEEKDERIAFDAIIATGSNNSSRYFDYYFSKYPHIIRRNRNSVAVFSGKETEEDLKNIGKDIFAYYGLGCRSVSKIFVPQNYDFQDFFKHIVEFSDVINNPKYADNYDYNKAVYLMSGAKLLDNNFLLLKEDLSLSSPIGVLFYERYDDIEKLSEKLVLLSNEIQCVVSKSEIKGIKTESFGAAQNPSIFDFADGVDTMNFLKSII
ncbi:MAG: hypothetical protein II956_10355 [Bacteroidales bacterium]|nr:hypothetical protein [Bacteroidales bacterium]